MDQYQITTKAGTYIGTKENSGVLSFKGIPFAQPPLGDLRWQPPQPLTVYDNKRRADIFPPAPIQLNYPQHLADQMEEPIHIPISEDCLYLNVWVSDLTTPKKGILFWIYGGSYAIGHASRVQSRGEAFVAAHPDIMVVAPNYRLGVFGSINLDFFDGSDQYRCSNNLNLLDQRAALQWVRENARLFGADPDTITLYGHSAGSNAICHHLASRESLPLFRRAICQSSFLQGPPPRTLEESRAFSKKIFDYLGITTLDEALLISSDRLLQAQKQVFGEIYGSPVIDNVVVFDKEFDRMMDGTVSGKQIMIGYSNGERDSGFVDLDERESVEKVLKDNKRFLKGKSGPVEKYLAQHPDDDTKQLCMTAQAELMMTIPAETMARALALHNDVYQFQFSWADPATNLRAPHGAPCPFVFGNQVPKSAPLHLKEQVQNTWASFITSGDPNNDLIPNWPLYTPRGGVVMNIDEVWNPIDDFWPTDYPIFAPLYEDYRELEEVLENDNQTV